jgi:hypothetical protein
MAYIPQWKHRRSYDAHRGIATRSLPMIGPRRILPRITMVCSRCHNTDGFFIDSAGQSAMR